MIITDLLKRNAELYPEEVCLVEINPEAQPRPVTWSEYELIESSRYDGCLYILAYSARARL